MASARKTVERVDVLHAWCHRSHAYIFAGPFTTIEQALVSCNFAFACALVYGRHDWEAVKAGFTDRRVAELAQRVHVDSVSRWGFTDGAVTVATRDGRRLSASAAEIPDELIRPNWEQMVAKFHTLSGFVPAVRRRAIVEAVEFADTRPDLEALSGALRATA